MPFLILDHKEDFLNSLDASKIVTCQEFLKWRKSHKERIERNLSVPNVELGHDPVFVRFQKQSILNLIDLNTNHYLGILFACNWIDPDYRNLTAFICKAKKASNKFDIIPETVYDENGKKGDYENYVVHYANRIRRLRKKPQTKDFGSEEMSGIYHLSSSARVFVEKISTEYIKLWFLHDLKKTTVVIADDDFDPDKYTCTTLEQPALYDHGTGCCTINN